MESVTLLCLPVSLSPVRSRWPNRELCADRKLIADSQPHGGSRFDVRLTWPVRESSDSELGMGTVG